MKLNQSTSIKALVVITSLALLFHFFIVLKIIPYDITWGGRLKTDEEMYVFEFISLIINSFFIYVLLQKGNFVKPIFSKKTVSIILWVFFVLFILNTVGNVFAQSTFEKVFALITLINAFLLWKVNKGVRSNHN